MNQQVDQLRKVSGRSMLWGVLTILIGMMAIAAPLASGLAVAIIIGVALLAAGVSMTLYAFQAPSLGKVLLKLLFGGLTLLVGLAVVAQPGIALAQLTMLLGIYFIVDGFLTFIVAWNVKPEAGWGWMTFNGLIAVVLGVMIMKGWPSSAAWVIGLLVGIRLVFSGIVILTLGSTGRRLAKSFSD